MPPLTPPDAWRYAGGKRDLRFDLLRGFAVCAMVIDHIGGPASPLYAISGGNRFYASAAEAFVFLSGLLMGLVNGGLIRRGDIGVALDKSLRRAGMLYGVTVGLTLVTAALPLLLGLPWAPDPGGRSTVEYIVGTVTLQHAAYLTDIPFLYTLLVLAAEPALVLLERGRTRLLLGLSWGLWLLYQLWPSQAGLWPPDRDFLFQFSSWQILFMTALVLGFHRHRLERAFRAAASPACLLIAGAAFAGLIALYRADLAPLVALTGRDAAQLGDWFLNKQAVGAGRLLAFVVVALFAYALVSLCWGPLARALGWLLLPLGQNSLSAYVVHIFVVGALAGLATSLFADAPWGAALIQAGGVLLVWCAIRARPGLAASLEGLESVWAESPSATGADTARLIAPDTVSLDARIAQAQAAGRDGDFLR